MSSESIERILNPEQPQTPQQAEDTPRPHITKPLSELMNKPTATKTFSDEDVSLIFFTWYLQPIPDRSEHTAKELSARHGLPVEAITAQQKKVFAAWLMRPEGLRDPARREDLAAKLGMHNQGLSRWLKDEGFAANDLRAAARARILPRVTGIIDNLANMASSPLGGAPEIKLALETAGIKSDKGANVNVNVQQNANVYNAPITTQDFERIPEVANEVIDVEPE